MLKGVVKILRKALSLPWPSRCLSLDLPQYKAYARAMTFGSRIFIILFLVSIALLSQARAAEQMSFAFPVDCVLGETCIIQNFVDHDQSATAKDYRCGALTYDGHDGTDIRIASLAEMRRGVNVLAAADGTVLRTRDGIADQSIRAAGAISVDGRECGNAVIVDHGQGWQTQYCHLALGSVQMSAGAKIKRGDVIGRIGLSGQTEFPHLHFMVRRDGRIIDPLTSTEQKNSCGGGEKSLLRPTSGDGQFYRDAFVLNRGFVDGAIEIDAIETGGLEARKPHPQSPALVAYIRVVGLKAGDVQHFKLTGPSGAVLTDKTFDPMDRPKAQNALYIGKKRTGEPWPVGRYDAVYEVIRDGASITKERFSIEF